jgi:alkylated DNA repair dioxygenase AlkB
MIDGLLLIDNYLNWEEQLNLCRQIDLQHWDTTLKRRVQHYGYRYDYQRRGVESSFIGELPEWIKEFTTDLKNKKITDLDFDQIIINEYQPGQGISGHVDCISCFGDTIISMSILGGCIMSFQHIGTKQQVDIYLKAGSLLVMSGEARYNWKHGIPGRKSDTVNGLKMMRSRRLSLTFRKVLD